jgi:hypothetical protein
MSHCEYKSDSNILTLTLPSTYILIYLVLCNTTIVSYLLSSSREDIQLYLKKTLSHYFNKIGSVSISFRISKNLRQILDW